MGSAVAILGERVGVLPGRVVRVSTLLQLALLLLVTGNIGRIPALDLGDRTAPILINDLCIGAVLAAGAIAMLRTRSLRLNDVALTALVFVAVAGLSAVAAMPRFGLTAFELVGSLAYLARWCAYFALYVVVINCVRAEESERLWTTLEAAMLVIAVFGIIQAIFLPNFALMVYPEQREVIDWDPQRNRLVSTILEPNVIAAMIAATLLMQLARMASGIRTAWWKPGVMLTALLFTLSRSGMLALLVGAVIVVATRGVSKRVLRFGGLMLLLALPGIPRFISFANEYQRFGITDGSAVARVHTWQRAFAAFLESPWFGIGFNTYGFVQERRGFERLGGASYSAEGGLLFIAVMTGIVGLVVFLAMLWFVFSRCRRGWRDPRATPEERALLIGTTAATVAVLVHSVFVNSLLVPFVMEMLWVLWALSFTTAISVARRPFAISTA